MKFFSLLFDLVCADTVIYGPIDVYVKSDPSCMSMRTRGCQSSWDSKSNHKWSCEYQDRCHYAKTDYWWYNKVIVVKIPAFYCEVRDRCS